MSIIEITPDDIQWTHDAIVVLIECFRQHKDDFRDEKKKKKDVWRVIAQEMNTAGFFVTANMCDRKWRNLKQTYKGILQHNAQSGGRKRKSWTYLHHFESIFGQDLGSLFPPSSNNILPFRQTGLSKSSPNPTSSSNGPMSFITSLDFASGDHHTATPGKGNRKRLRPSIPPPRWFGEYMEQRRQEDEKWRRDLYDLLKRHVDAQEQRTAVLTDLANILKETLTKDTTNA